MKEVGTSAVIGGEWSKPLFQGSISKASKVTTAPLLQGTSRRVAPETERSASWGVAGNVTRFLAQIHPACQSRWLNLIS